MFFAFFRQDIFLLSMWRALAYVKIQKINYNSIATSGRIPADVRIVGDGTVPDPGKGVCADPVNRGAIWRGRDRVPQAGTKSVSWAQTREEERCDKMRIWQEVKEDYPLMASRREHAQSEFTRIAQEESV